MMAVAFLAALVAAVALGLGVAARGGPRARRRVRFVVLAVTVLVAGALTPYTVADSGASAAYLLGVPVLAAAVPVAADMSGVARNAADATGAVVMTGWALLLALGIGTAFLPGGLLLLILAVAGLAPPDRS
jgi:hypothetical protein